jgi:uncharacterized glyoxalase superfamily protein PhnB
MHTEERTAMTEGSKTGSDTVPMLYYDDVVAAQAWLSSAFGLETARQHTNRDGDAVGAEMRIGSGVVMLLGGDDAQFGLRSAKEQGVATGGAYITLDDVDAHYEVARAAGATIVVSLQDMDYGSCEYGALDLEGQFWSFGTYRPG